MRGERVSFISRGFRGRRRPEGVDAARIPPGQHLTRDSPVLSGGPTPQTPLDEWTFRGRVGDRPAAGEVALGHPPAA